MKLMHVKYIKKEKKTSKLVKDNVVIWKDESRKMKKHASAKQHYIDETR